MVVLVNMDLRFEADGKTHAPSGRKCNDCGHQWTPESNWKPDALDGSGYGGA